MVESIDGSSEYGYRDCRECRARQSFRSLCCHLQKVIIHVKKPDVLLEAQTVSNTPTGTVTKTVIFLTQNTGIFLPFPLVLIRAPRRFSVCQISARNHYRWSNCLHCFRAELLQLCNSFRVNIFTNVQICYLQQKLRLVLQDSNSKCQIKLELNLPEQTTADDPRYPSELHFAKITCVAPVMLHLQSDGRLVEWLRIWLWN